MGRSVFISVLGTGLYSNCTYVGATSRTTTRFIQEATLNEIGASSWSKTDAAYILVTGKSKESNWEISDNKRFDSRTKTLLDYRGLKGSIDDMHLPFETRPIDIPDGAGEREMWELFETIYGLIKDGDQLYFDLTHAFRYIPMMILTIGSYAGFLKNAHICYISYGNYEARSNSSSGNPEEDEAPIINLMPLAALQDWTFAAGQFVESGNASAIQRLSKKEYAPILKATAGQDSSAKSLQQYIESLCCTISERNHCRGLEIINSSSANMLRERAIRLKGDFIPALYPIIDKVNHSLLCGLSTYPDTKNLYAAAKWCAEKGLHQQAITILRESFVTVLCKRNGLDMKSKEQREYAELALRKKCDNQDVNTANGEIVNTLLSDEIFKEFPINKFKKLRDLRNDYNHCGMRDNPCSPNNMDKYLNDALSSFEVMFSLEKCFINYSNHPSRDWSECQLDAAKEYGVIIDIPFPKVDPGDSELANLIDVEFEKLRKASAGKDATIHIMGEMTLCFSLIKKLKSKGIRCVASTTKRNGYGSNFEFVTFREYE